MCMKKSKIRISFVGIHVRFLIWNAIFCQKFVNCTLLIQKVDIFDWYMKLNKNMYNNKRIDFIIFSMERILTQARFKALTFNPRVIVVTL